MCKERAHLKPLVHDPRVEKASDLMQQDLNLNPLDELYREDAGALLSLAATFFPTVRAISAGALVEVGAGRVQRLCRLCTGRSVRGAGLVWRRVDRLPLLHAMPPVGL